MKLADLFKQLTLDDLRQMLIEAIEEGKITYNTDLPTAFQIILDSLDFVQFTMMLEEAGLESWLHSTTVRKFLLEPDRLDSKHESERKNKSAR
jgi:hypothetical protein